MEFKPDAPLQGPIHLDVVFVLGIPQSWPKWKKAAAAAGDLCHVSKPDRDNLLKLLKDALNGVFWVDDSQVCSGSCEKRYGEVPQTQVRIRTLAQAEAPTKKGKAA